MVESYENQGTIEEFLKDLYGAGRTAFKGANQGSALMLGTAGNLLGGFSPLPPKEGTLESALYNLNNKWIQPLVKGALEEPPTDFEKKYSEPLWRTKSGTTIVPSLGELVRGMGEFIPEMMFSASAPASKLGSIAEQRFASMGPELASTIGKATKSSFGGMAGGLAKGDPEQAAWNALTFPLMEMVGEGAGYYAKQSAKALKNELPAIKKILRDETGAARFFNNTVPPIPESPKTISVQLDSLINRRSKAMLLPPGSQMPELPKGFKSLDTEVGTWFYDPKKLGKAQIQSKVVKGNYGELLGHVEPKSQNTNQVVSAIQDGVEAKTSLTSPENISSQAQILKQQFPNADIVTGGSELAKDIVHARIKGQVPNNVIPFPQETSAGNVPPSVNPPEGFLPGKLERGFTQTVRESPMSPDPLAKGVSGTYDPITNKSTMESAQRSVAENPIAARDFVLSTKEPTAESYAMAMELMRLNNAKGDFGESIRIANHMATQATQQGQAIQALSMYNRLGPDGILRFASKFIKDAREAGPKAKLAKLEDKTNKIISFLQDQGESNINKDLIREQVANELKLPNLSEDFSKNIVERASALQQMPEGREKALVTAELLRDIAELVPASLLRKISSFQTIAQLANPKTLIRNITGNAAFTAGENVKDLIAAPLDMTLSVLTGKRTKSLGGLNQIGAQAKGFISGLKEGAQEAWRGVDLTNIADKWEINGLKNGLPAGRTFRGKILGNIERTLGVGLRAPDRAFYKAAFEKSLAEQQHLAGLKTPTEDMIKNAHFEGLYKTFQDDSAASRVFSGIKKSLNLGKEFGAGDILIKYPKTPGNLLSRSIEYSPAGFVKSLIELGRIVRGHGFDQKAFVDATSRAIVGSGGLTLFGYFLSKLGLLRNTAPRDPELRGIERKEGLNQSQLNVTAINRYLMNGFNKTDLAMKPGDTIVTYDWAVPLSVPISMGARAQEKGMELADPGLFGVAAAGLEGGLETLGDQPLIKTFTQLAQGKTLPESLIEAGKGIPASFTPTLFKQINQLSDNTLRDTKDSNPAKMAMNLVLGKTPFADKLPEKIDQFGDPMEAYQGGTNSIMNVMFNPAFVAKYKPTPETKVIMDLYRNTSDARIMPLVVGTKFKHHGIRVEMNAKDRNEMQKWVGTKTKKFLSKVANNEEFLQADDDDKVKVLTGAFSDLRNVARSKYLYDKIMEKPSNQRDAFAQELFKKNKLTEKQIESFFNDMAEYKDFLDLQKKGKEK